MICFYYGLTAFACIWYFRNELFLDFPSVVFKLLFPLLGGLGLLAVVFVVTLRDSASPDYGSGASIGGVGLVLILGLGIIAGVGVDVLAAGQGTGVLPRRDTSKDTPALIIEN